MGVEAEGDRRPRQRPVDLATSGGVATRARRLEEELVDLPEDDLGRPARTLEAGRGAQRRGAALGGRSCRADDGGRVGKERAREEDLRASRAGDGLLAASGAARAGQLLRPVD